MLIPRDYQQESADKAIAHMRKTDEPGVLVLTTAAGKSIVVAIVSHVVQRAGKRVLCLVPSGDLVLQNSEKYRAIGEQCSIFSASLNKKNTGHQVVFATPKSVINSLSDFDDEYALLIIDEAQMVSEADQTVIQQIIAYLRSRNAKLRILGLTATPVRGKTKLIDDDRTFKHVIHELPHHVLADLGWVVSYKLGHVHDHYDLAKLKTQGNGKFKQSEVDDATLNKERLTKSIIADVINIMAVDNRKCAMVFAASIKHAQEILSYLPEGSATLITGKTNKTTRKNEIQEAREENGWKFLITVSALGVGTDIPRCDTVVFLTATESIGRLLQFMGRSCRLYDKTWRHAASELNWKHPDYNGKTSALVLDYGENIERFSLDDDLTITGLVEEKNKQDDDEFFEIDCPDCGTANRHTAQRCVGVTSAGRCDYRFIFKECPACQAKNSPSARHCYKCEAELIDPNDKLSRNPAIGAGTPFHVAVMDMTLREHWKGESQSLRVTYKVTDGDKTWEISEYFKANNYGFSKFMAQTGGIANSVELAVKSAAALNVPSRLMVKKKKGSKWFDVINRYFEADRKNQLDAIESDTHNEAIA